jgi:hypothetical protein
MTRKPSAAFAFSDASPSNIRDRIAGCSMTG